MQQIIAIIGIVIVSIFLGYQINKMEEKDNCVQYKKVKTTILQGTIARTATDSICICKFDPSKNELVTLNIEL